MIDATTLLRHLACASLALGLSGCMTQEAAQSNGVTVAEPVPLQRSYLDPGPAPASGGGPNYVRANRTSAAQQTDGFGNDLIPRVP